jgi:hypothetical protein
MTFENRRCPELRIVSHGTVPCQRSWGILLVLLAETKNEYDGTTYIGHRVCEFLSVYPIQVAD